MVARAQGPVPHGARHLLNFAEAEVKKTMAKKTSVTGQGGKSNETNCDRIP